MAHPQSSPRGYFVKQRIDIGSSSLTFNSTAVIFSKGLRVSGATPVITANSTALIASAGLRVSGATPVLTANSTAFIASAGVAFSGVSAKTITANSTGIRIGALYISCNSTGNTTT